MNIFPIYLTKFKPKGNNKQDQSSVSVCTEIEFDFLPFKYLEICQDVHRVCGFHFGN